MSLSKMDLLIKWREKHEQHGGEKGVLFYEKRCCLIGSLYMAHHDLDQVPENGSDITETDTYHLCQDLAGVESMEVWRANDGLPWGNTDCSPISVHEEQPEDTKERTLGYIDMLIDRERAQERDRASVTGMP